MIFLHIQFSLRSEHFYLRNIILFSEKPCIFLFSFFLDNGNFHSCGQSQYYSTFRNFYPQSGFNPQQGPVFVFHPFSRLPMNPYAYGPYPFAQSSHVFGPQPLFGGPIKRCRNCRSYNRCPKPVGYKNFCVRKTRA